MQLVSSLGGVREGYGSQPLGTVYVYGCQMRFRIGDLSCCSWCTMYVGQWLAGCLRCLLGVPQCGC
jgi:hypothetical protein